MARALNKHLEKNKLYSDIQHGYRQNRSTATALIQLQEDILAKFEESKSSALLCFDSGAAFDTVTHSILLEKLKLYGADEEVINWFSTNLEDIFQYCGLGGKRDQQSQRFFKEFFKAVCLVDHSHKGVSGAAIANFRFVFFSSEPLKDL